MPAGNGTVAVRMYNVGFGDAFLVTVRRGGTAWRMLVDCGVHSHGQARPIRESVEAIITDLAAEDPQGVPHLDVIAATHHHADHISGFSLPAWEDVVVEEVWLPFVEDQADPDAMALRRAQTATAQALLGLISMRLAGLNGGRCPTQIAAARSFALNSFGNEDATDRLVGRNGQHFANRHHVRYLPSLTAADNRIPLPPEGAVAHVLGPSRDPKELARMNPPANAGWFQLNLDSYRSGEDTGSRIPLFNADFVVDDLDRLPGDLARAKRTLRLNKVTNDAGLLSAASVLERAVNNTSLFLVLDVAGTRLIFPGDAQQGAWDHVLSDPANKALVRDAAFYKIGHHGSHNATPKSFVEEVWQDGGYAMLPWGRVKRWQDTIPKRELLDALAAHHHTVIRADSPQPVPDKINIHDDLWTEVVLTTD